MWNADAVDYISNTTEAIKERTEMWAAIPVFQKTTNVELGDNCIVFEYLPSSIVDLMVVN